MQSPSVILGALALLALLGGSAWAGGEGGGGAAAPGGVRDQPRAAGPHPAADAAPPSTFDLRTARAPGAAVGVPGSAGNALVARDPWHSAGDFASDPGRAAPAHPEPTLRLVSWPTFGSYSYVSEEPLNRSNVNVTVGKLLKTTGRRFDAADSDFDMGSVWRQGFSFSLDYRYVLNHYVSFGGGYQQDRFGRRLVGFVAPATGLPTTRRYPNLTIQSLYGVFHAEAPFGLEEIELEQLRQYRGLFAFAEVRLGFAAWEGKKVIDEFTVLDTNTGFLVQRSTTDKLKTSPHLFDTLSVGLGWKGDLGGALGYGLRSYWNPSDNDFKTSHYGYVYLNLYFYF